jgi:isoquinoline 1-oxidoreductase beta subunit
MLTNCSRRRFLEFSSAAGAALVLGCHWPADGRAARRAAANNVPLNAFVRIAASGEVTVLVHKSEMGQGVFTALPMLLAEELEVAWGAIRVEAAPAHPDYYHTKWGPFQGTGASTSISTAWSQLRRAGAAAREMLIASAAARWNVPAEECRALEGHVEHLASQRRTPYGELVAAAARLPVPAEPRLKDPAQFKLIGRSIPRLDSRAKATGAAQYGMDFAVSGMLIAVIERAPVFGARVQSVDRSKLAGRQDVRCIELANGVALLADSFHTAQQARQLIEVQWQLPKQLPSSAAILASYSALAVQHGLPARTVGDAKLAFEQAARTFELEFTAPYLAHAAMEPLNCVADVRADGCDIWVGTQMQTTDQAAACAITGLRPAQVRVHTLLLGGSFGRRANPHADFVKEAVQLSNEVRRPVKVIWTREDDMRGGYYRPLHYSRLRVALDAQSRPTGWEHVLVGESIVAGTPFAGLLVHDGVDHLSVEGASDHPYAIANQHVSYHPTDNGIPILWWRSVGHSFTAFAVETAIDEIAHSSGQDPLGLRLELLRNEPRHRAVLLKAAELGNWSSEPPAGTYRGLALHKSFGSFVAQVVEITLDAQRRPRVTRVVCAVDCGLVVNPAIVRAQIESGIVYGLSAALHGEITLKDGRVEQSNFHDYPVLRMQEMPQIDVHVLASSEPPTGVGEISTPPIAPALCNALTRATGQRITRLPLLSQRA